MKERFKRFHTKKKRRSEDFKKEKADATLLASSSLCVWIWPRNCANDFRIKIIIFFLAKHSKGEKDAFTSHIHSVKSNHLNTQQCSRVVWFIWIISTMLLFFGRIIYHKFNLRILWLLYSVAFHRKLTIIFHRFLFYRMRWVEKY